MASGNLLPSSRTRPLATNKSRSEKTRDLLNIVRINFSLTTFMLIGACLQSVLILLLPKRYALIPAIVLLMIRAIDTILVTYGIKHNRFIDGALMKKTTALPLSADGKLEGPGQEKIAILLLGAKSNHPLGVFAPDFNIVGNYINQMSQQMESGTDQDNGFLGQTSWTRSAANGANELLFISYWRSLDAIHAYAHGPLHREAWAWWERTLKQHDYIGLMHEAFEAPKGAFENVYINFQPMGLGATTYLRRNGKLEGGRVASEWVSPLVDANRGLLRTAVGRRGQVGDAADKDKFGVNPYIS